MNAVAHSPRSEAPDSEKSSYAKRLVGVWSLVTYTDEHEHSGDTQPFGPSPQGLHICSSSGGTSIVHLLGVSGVIERIVKGSAHQKLPPG
jgi:hypothetical protein